MLLDLDGLLGFRGWQWVLIVTGIPAVIIGFITLFYLDDAPTGISYTPKKKTGFVRRWQPKTALCRKQATRTL